MSVHFGIGRRGMGKTTLMYRMASRVPRRLIFDPRGMIRANPDAVLVFDIEDMRIGIREVQAGSITEIVFTPSGDLNEAFDAFAEELRNWIVRTPQLTVAVLIDEASFIDQRSKHFQWVIRCSPPDTFHVMLTCHRPLDIDTTVRAIADHWLIFHCTQEHDLKVLSSRCSPEVAEHVQRLRPRHFVHWNDARATLSINRNGGTGGPNDWFIPLRANVEQPPPSAPDIHEPGEPAPERRSGGMGRLPLVAHDSDS